ncbi:hypothetical protein [Paenibacillus tyrfis]|uniref:Uncharacterized protein n=1 Tax=Paenibacillus tyrfis TaxID=1501230 RepID=A0A081NV36_9BACL|nr:hypothetical protein [Paenibacillus tyrfis]KEQ22309.1 hypothetical protein ET33_26420 [Paenibacillus tyrfis]
MTAFLLLQALRTFLGEAVAEYAAAQGGRGEYQVPKVFDWFLPFKNPKAEQHTDFPYIVARIIEGDDPVYEPMAPLFSTIRVDLAFGIYHESAADDGFVHPDGAYDLLNLMEHVRIALFRKGVLENKFRIEKPYRWQIPEEQPYPLWVGTAQSTWTVQSATQQMIEGVDLHGYI